MLEPSLTEKAPMSPVAKILYVWRVDSLCDLCTMVGTR
jgi:hypothetical protein